VCWDLKERGAVGETCLHLCLLNATSIHADLAKRLLRFYPKLINDIYMCDEYYGMFILRCVFPVALVNSKGIFIEKEKDITAECILAECFYQSIAMNMLLANKLCQELSLKVLSLDHPL